MEQQFLLLITQDRNQTGKTLQPSQDLFGTGTTLTLTAHWTPKSYPVSFSGTHCHSNIAQSGDTYEKIAEDVQVSAANLRKFNDTKGNSQPVANEIVYIEVKSKNNVARVHVVQPGETLRYIAQRYGVQLLYIFKYNALDENSIIHPGDQILLRH